MDKHTKKLAYEAGQALASHTNNLGLHHCPFPEGDPQRAEYLRGLHDALEGPRSNPATLIKEINDELKIEDHAS